MKRLAILCLALVLMLSTFVLPALADVVNYVPVTPSNSSINHTMELTDSPYNLDYNITYSFADNQIANVRTSRKIAINSEITRARNS